MVPDNADRSPRARATDLRAPAWSIAVVRAAEAADPRAS
jgi:hypothetical protein